MLKLGGGAVGRMQKVLTIEVKTDTPDFRFNNSCSSKGTIKEDN